MDHHLDDTGKIIGEDWYIQRTGETEWVEWHQLFTEMAEDDARKEGKLNEEDKLE